MGQKVAPVKILSAAVRLHRATRLSMDIFVIARANLEYAWGGKSQRARLGATLFQIPSFLVTMYWLEVEQPAARPRCTSFITGRSRFVHIIVFLSFAETYRSVLRQHAVHGPTSQPHSRREDLCIFG